MQQVSESNTLWYLRARTEFVKNSVLISQINLYSSEVSSNRPVMLLIEM